MKEKGPEKELQAPYLFSVLLHPRWVVTLPDGGEWKGSFGFWMP